VKKTKFYFETLARRAPLWAPGQVIHAFPRRRIVGAIAKRSWEGTRGTSPPALARSFSTRRPSSSAWTTGEASWKLWRPPVSLPESRWTR